MTTLSFDVLWRDRGAAKGLQTMARASERAEIGMGRLRNTAKVASLIVGAAIVKFGVDSVKAYSEAQSAQAKLQNAFQKFPRLADTNIGALRKLNTELALKTKFDDDATASGQAVLAQFKLTGTQIQQLTPLLQDYAARTGKDLPTAATVLGKAVMGQGRALKAVGINFKDTGTTAGNLEQIMVGLRQQVGGFAQAEGKTAAGQVAILKNQFGELQEEAGSHLVPALTKVVAGATKAVVAFGELGPGMKAGITTLALGLPTMAIAAAGIGKIGTVAKETSAALKLMGITAKGATIATAGIGAALGVAALAFGFYATKQAEAKQQTDDFTEALIASNGAIDDNIRTMAKKALQDKGAFDNADRLGISLQDVTDAALGNDAAMRRVMTAVDHYGAAVDSADTKTQDQVQAANELSDALLPMRRRFDDGQKAAGQFGRASGQATDAQGNLIKGTKNARAELEKWVTSANKAARAALGLTGSQIDYEQAVDDATKSVKDNGKTLDVNTDKGRNNRRALINLASSSLAYREKLIDQGASQKRVTAATDDARQAFIRTAIKMGATKREAKELADKFGLLDRRIDGIHGKKVTISFGTGSYSIGGVKFRVNLSSPSSVGRRASGGLVRGPGTGTSDSILGVDAHTGWPTTRVSNGEFVVNAKSTAMHRAKLETINRSGLAAGGYFDSTFGMGRFGGAWRVPSTASRFGDTLARAMGKELGRVVGSHLTLPAPAMGGFTAASGGSNRAIGHRMMLQRWSESQWPPLNSLWTRESGWNTFALNRSSGAYGIPQSLPAGKMASAGSDWRTNPATQIAWGLGYIAARYGSPSGAWAHSQATGWYDRGGVLRPGLTLAYNGTGRNEYVVPAGGGRGAVVVNQHFHFDRYVGSRNELIQELVKAKREGRMDVVLR